MDLHITKSIGDFHSAKISEDFGRFRLDVKSGKGPLTFGTTFERGPF